MSGLVVGVALWMLTGLVLAVIREAAREDVARAVVESREGVER